jgi:hypothetical protein
VASELLSFALLCSAPLLRFAAAVLGWKVYIRSQPQLHPLYPGRSLLPEKIGAHEGLGVVTRTGEGALHCLGNAWVVHSR